MVTTGAKQMTKAQKISEMILNRMQERICSGESQQQALRNALDDICGAGTYQHLKDDLYYALRAKAAA